MPSDAITSSEPDHAEPVVPVCVLVFNSNDPGGAGGLAADVLAMACVGVHALPVMTGAQARDSAKTFDFYPLDDEAVAEQARAVLEDMAVQAIKLGFAGSPGNLGVVAGISADYEEIPLIAYMPDLTWWHDDAIDAYHQAFVDLILPQTSVLIGSYSTLTRWLLPNWHASRSPGARDIALAAGEHGASYTLVTGIGVQEDGIENTLSSPQSLLVSARVERLPASFTGTGDTLSAAFSALLANGYELTEAFSETLSYIEGSLKDGFRPGMGHSIPDRLFWAQSPPSNDTAGVDLSTSDSIF